MKTKIYNFLFNTAQKIKRRLGISNFEAFKKKQKRKFFRLIYKKKFNSDDLVSVMKTMGMQKGSIVFIHSSMTEFYNYTGTAIELIDKIIEVIGEDGTLMMPAYINSSKMYDEEVDFDVLNSPSNAGFLTEVFRKYPGVKRSINLQHSVCAYGRLANHMISEHHLSFTAWDEFSPYYKMSQVNTLVFSLGLPKMIGTIIHCPDSILRTKYKYFQQFFDKETIYKYRDYNGDIFEHRQLSHDFARRMNKDTIIKNYFNNDEIVNRRISNLTIRVINAKQILNRLLQLADNGITIYSIPSTKNYQDKNGKFLKVQNN